MEQKAACKYRCERTDEIRAKPSRNRMAGLRDTHRAEVDSNNVKRRFRTAINRRSHIAQNIVRSELFHQVRQYCRRTAAAQRPDQYHRNQVRWELNREQKGVQKIFQDL